MFLLILSVLLFVPLKLNFIHANMLSIKRKKGNIIIHIFIWFHFLTLSFIDQGTPIKLPHYLLSGEFHSIRRDASVSS